MLLQDLKRYLAFGYYFLRVWGLRRKIGTASTGRVLIAGLLSSPNGIGEGGRLIRSGLETLGYDTSVFDLSPIIQPELSTIPVAEAGEDDETGPIILHINPSEVPKALFCLRDRNLRKRRIIGVWAWELERAPKYWKYCAGWFDEIWSISDFMSQSLGDLPVPVETVGYPVATSVAPMKKIDWRETLQLEEDFIVLIAFDTRSSLARKNPFAALEAFNRAFKNVPTAKLVVKVSGPIDDHSRARFQAENIVLLEQVMTRSEMQSLILSADCHLSLSRAEGLGLVAAEAAANGVPVVITGWSGPSEWSAAPNVHLVDFALTEITDETKIYRDGTGLRWAEADVEDAAAKLRFLFEQTESERNEVAGRAQEWWKSHYSVKAFESKIPKASLELFQKREL